jgi:hypothetical protein
MLKKCEHCNERVRFFALHNRECKKRRAFLKSQSKLQITEVKEEEVFASPIVEFIPVKIEQKPKKQSKKVKP